MGIQFQLKGEMGMNKYEKAFKHLREHASFDTVDEMIDIKELVERATPM